ncbi:hypothetical protein [Amycolatopsis sp. SID8362]|uniref:hypothetical protein n=1 Tax=Amycolatopsis sp. SID8362 TaxID=2690346 RepID=UPI001369836D|nr:hypothetical protein [Amycolatopsis sp. SID8362]NBH10054.1 hypothetical protein [Amycolatopsis sp. SID8362]NED46748.1 hypothetical protein [Amycolatopsis sp. SID8362]
MNKKLVGSAVVGAAVLAIAAALVWPRADTPAAAPPPSPAPSIGQGTLEVYRLADGPAIEIPVPSGWAVSRDKERASYRHGDVLLETDRVPITQEDVLSGLKAVAGRQGGTVTEHAPIADIDAAEWDFTYDRDGVPRRVTVVGLGAGDALVTVRFDAPAAEFERDRGVLDEALKIRT